MIAHSEYYVHRIQRVVKLHERVDKQMTQQTNTRYVNIIQTLITAVWKANDRKSGPRFTRDALVVISVGILDAGNDVRQQLQFPVKLVVLETLKRQLTEFKLRAEESH